MSKKVDLTLLKRLVGELEGALNIVDSIKTDINTDNNELFVEASKAIGLASGVMQEAAGLMGDIQALLVTAPTKSKSEFLEKLMDTLKGPGSTN